MTNGSAPETPGKDPPTTNSNKPVFTRQKILCGLSIASVVRIMRVNAVLTDDREQQTDLDIHADTCVMGQHAPIVPNFNRPVNIVGQDLSKGIMNTNYQTWKSL